MIGGCSILLAAQSRGQPGRAATAAAAAAAEEEEAPGAAAPQDLGFVGQQRKVAERALLTTRGALDKKRLRKSPFIGVSGHRGTSERGKKNHFHLLDRYIRRIDSLVPPEMEDFVRPMRRMRGQRRNASQTLRLVLGVDAEIPVEEDVREFLDPWVPTGVLIVESMRRTKEIYVQFRSHEEAMAAKRKIGGYFGGDIVLVHDSTEEEYQRVSAEVAEHPAAGHPESDQDDAVRGAAAAAGDGVGQSPEDIKAAPETVPG